MIRDEELKKMLVEGFSMSETDLDKITPDAEREFLNALPNMANYRLVAEVISSKYCSAGLQVGQKFVVEDATWINTQESTAPMCVFAIAPLMTSARILMDRFTQNGKPTTLKMTGFRCLDPGLELGGLGRVEFKVIVEEK
jgi:uncharacterized repeat protein (TIGR04076 family)